MATTDHITPDNMNLNVVGKATSQPLGSGSKSVESGRKGKSSSRRNRGGRGETGMSQQAMKRRDHWANQLCTPEWMLTVPSDLNGAGSPVGAGEQTSKSKRTVGNGRCGVCNSLIFFCKHRAWPTVHASCSQGKREELSMYRRFCLFFHELQEFSISLWSFLSTRFLFLF